MSPEDWERIKADIRKAEAMTGYKIKVQAVLLNGEWIHIEQVDQEILYKALDSMELQMMGIKYE